MPTPLRCDPQLFEKDLKGQVIIVTGANSGCGLETSRQLCKQGATVVLACRSKERGEAAAQEVGENGFFLQLDLSDLDSVRAFGNAFEAAYDRLDALVNNAGIMACPFGKTKQDFEMQIGCNHLAHFLLQQLLTPMLLKTAETTKKPSRFIALSSVAASAMRGTDYATIEFDDLFFETNKYDSSKAYQQSKLANYLHALEAGKRYESSKLISVSVHPGWVHSNLDQHFLGTGMFKKIMNQLFFWSGHMISAPDGAQTTLHCLLEDADKMKSGSFYSQFGIYKDPESKAGGWPMALDNPNATPEVATKLWEASEKLVGV
jgi:NAD(P)-dependent dehydrogenase (short-subunit alcohol dehydrogenase family)